MSTRAPMDRSGVSGAGDRPAAARPKRPARSRIPPLTLQGRIGNSGVLKAVETSVAGARLYGNLVRRGLRVSRPYDALEREAERGADRGVRHAPMATSHSLPAGPQALSTSDVAGELPVAVRRELSPRFGRGIDGVRVFQGAESAQAAALLGARAFTHGRDIYLGASESAFDRDLMAHELAHAVANRDTIQRREATWLERRAWLAFFDHYLPRKFLNNYMDDTGTPITLTATEMQDCNPIVDLQRSRAFMAELGRLRAAGGGTSTLSCTGWGGAKTNGTLGNFTIHYDGALTVAADGSWTFAGTMWFEDYWDFNTGGPNRPVAAEVKVRVANAFLPGRPFPIDSVRVPVSQAFGDRAATWSATTVQHVPDRLGRTGADIEVGAGGGEAGGAVAGPEVEVGAGAAGGEFGAQSSEDLNR